jgi:hypothetical protein
MTERTILKLEIVENVETGEYLGSDKTYETKTYRIMTSATYKTPLADLDRAHVILSEHLTTLRYTNGLAMPRTAEPFPEPSE